MANDGGQMRITAIIAICVVFTGLIAAGAEAADLPKTAQIVPARTILLVDTADFNQLRAKFEKSSIYRLYKDPALAPFMESFTGKFQKKLREEDNPVVKTILDANGLPEGKTAFALVQAGGAAANNELSVLVISQWGSNVSRLKEAIDKMAVKAVEQGAHRAIEDYRDVNIVTLTTEVAPTQVPDWENTNPEDSKVPVKTIRPPASKTCYCFIDDCLIAATDVDTVKFVVAHIQGASGDALIADADYVSLMGALGPYHDVDLYLNIRQILDRATADDKAGRARMELANLGLDNLAALGCSFGVNTDDKGAISGKAFLKTTGSRKGVLKIIETQAEPVRPPRFVPASAYSVFFLNADIRRAYDELVGIIYGFEPSAAMAMQMPLGGAGAEGEPAVSLRPDIIEYLGSEIVVAQSVKKPFSADAMPVENLIAVSVTNRGALEKSLSLIHKRFVMPNNPDATRELLGHTIYLLGPIGMPPFGSALSAQPPGTRARPQPARLAFTITDTHLIFGQENAVEQAVRVLSSADAESLSSAEWFAAAKSAVPSLVGLAAFEDTSASAELLWWMLKESAKAYGASVGIGSAAVLAQPDFQKLADVCLLPEFDLVRKYFGCSAFYGVTRADGFLFEFKYFNPKTADNH
jgi:hypothetical protein